jgi:outer membrane protein insertion porin family/translocation and assembly module TamA
VTGRLAGRLPEARGLRAGLWAGLWRARSLAGRLAVAFGAALSAATPARAQEVNCDPGDVEVRSLSFEGNHAFSDAELASAIVVTPSNRLQRVWGLRSLFGVRRCIARNEIVLDRARLVIYYRKRGYADVAVDTAVRDAGKNRVDVTFDIVEGRPTTITQLTFTGLADVADSARIVRNLPVRVRGPYDQFAIEVARDSIRRRLTNVGYPFAEVLVNSDVQRGDSAPPTLAEGDGTRPPGVDGARGGDGAEGAPNAQRTAQVEFSVIPGALTRIGSVTVQVQPRPGTKQQIPSAVVRDIMGLETGRLYRQNALERATRNLYQTDAYQHVKIEFTADSAQAQADSTVDVIVRLNERYMRSARVDAGFGTLDCFRTQGEYVNRNFLRSARRLELTGRLSKIGVGAPLDSRNIGKVLCGQAVKDPYSDTLNYYAGATIRQPTLFGLRTVPDITLYSELRSEYKAYRRVTPVGGIASLTRERFFRTPITYAYELSYGRTEASPALFCSVLNRCDPADRASFEELRRTAVASLLLTRDRTDNPLNPSRGYFARLNFRTGSRWILSDTAFQFNKVFGDLSRYWRVGDRSVLAARIELGTVLGQLDRTLPPQERLYAGGPNTVRGFRQNELGPSVYLVPFDSIRARFDSVTTRGDSAFTLTVPAGTKPQRVVPTGGNSVVVGNLELRVRSPFFPELLQFTLFTDVGEVWNRSADEPTLEFDALKVTPGLGVRVFSPVGAIRVDLGYNRYAPSPGAAYATGTADVGGAPPLLCVSPDNSVPATKVKVDNSEATTFTQGSYTSCNGALAPSRDTNFLKRIAFFFAIGQAF